MKKHIMFFEIDSQNFIQITFPYPVKEVEDWDILNTKFSIQGKMYQPTGGSHIDTTIEAIDEALARILPPNSSQQESDPDLGYLWNENRFQLMTRKKDDKFPDAPLAYPLWSVEEIGVSAWLTKKNGRYYFEVTPDFQWILDDNDEATPEEIEAFHKFMLTYKPIASVEAPQEKLIEWKKQCEEVLRYVKQNMQKIFPPK